MKELIKEAENMRAKLLEVMLNIPYDFEPDYTIAITQVADFLKKLFERKDNIVDLCEVFHNVVKKPDREKVILIDTNTLGYDVIRAKWHSDERWASFVSLYVIKRWAYLDDLLPKGGDNDKGRID